MDGNKACTAAMYPVAIPRMLESRKAPRYAFRCRAQVNNRAAVGDCIVRNVSLRGCYLETAHPLPIGSEIDLLIFIGDRIVRAGAKVRFLHAGCGMGVEFTHLRPRALSILQKLIRELESNRG